MVMKGLSSNTLKSHRNHQKLKMVQSESLRVREKNQKGEGRQMGDRVREEMGKERGRQEEMESLL